MAGKVLVVVDMQKDFVDGALGTKEAQAIVPAVLAKVRGWKGRVVFTQDTHYENYRDTQEGKLLPVPHCIVGTPGWELLPELAAYAKEHHCLVFRKNSFGSLTVATDLQQGNEEDPIEGIELIGLCTDICVVSNALLIKAVLPEIPVSVDSSCCAGVTPASHEAALTTLRSCQVHVY
ncbi:MAG: Isochorismatase family protein [Succiniclasticum sp.]|jgi:nicotinamidase-related amidase